MTIWPKKKPVERMSDKNQFSNRNQSIKWSGHFCVNLDSVIESAKCTKLNDTQNNVIKLTLMKQRNQVSAFETR